MRAKKKPRAEKSDARPCDDCHCAAQCKREQLACRAFQDWATFGRASTEKRLRWAPTNERYRHVMRDDPMPRKLAPEIAEQRRQMLIQRNSGWTLAQIADFHDLEPREVRQILAAEIKR